jgi:hypothetical protein
MLDGLVEFGIASECRYLEISHANSPVSFASTLSSRSLIGR